MQLNRAQRRSSPPAQGRMYRGLDAAQRKMTAEEFALLDSPVNTAIIALRLGTADETDRNTLAAAINIAHQIAGSVQRHGHLLPYIQAAADAANAGWQDVDAIDVCIEVYKGLIRQTPRKTVRRAIAKAVQAAQEGA